jgi:hypothetical protein
MVAHGSAWTYVKKDGTPSVYRRYYYFCATYRRATNERCGMARTRKAVWRVVRETALDPRRVREVLKPSRGGKKPDEEAKHLEALLAPSHARASSRNGATV